MISSSSFDYFDRLGIYLPDDRFTQPSFLRQDSDEERNGMATISASCSSENANSMDTVSTFKDNSAQDWPPAPLAQASSTTSWSLQTSEVPVESPNTSLVESVALASLSSLQPTNPHSSVRSNGKRKQIYWSIDDTKRLLKIVKRLKKTHTHNTIHWKQVSEKFALKSSTPRTIKQCREKYVHYSESRKVLTFEEKQRIRQLFYKHGPQYKLISSLTGCSLLRVREFFYQHIKKEQERASATESENHKQPARHSEIQEEQSSDEYEAQEMSIERPLKYNKKGFPTTGGLAPLIEK